MNVRLTVGHLAGAAPGDSRKGGCAIQLAPPEPISAPGKGAILVVAGGDACLEAAELARDHYYASRSQYPVEALRQALIAVRSATLHPNGREEAATPTRLMCAAIQEERLILGCLGGGGGAYLWRAGELVPLAYDDAEEAEVAGEAATAEPEVEAVAGLAEGDRLLLCTRGVYGCLSLEALAECLDGPEPQAACDRLLALAQEAGSEEGPAAIVADVRFEEAPEEIQQSDVPALLDAEDDDEVPAGEVPSWPAPQPELDWRLQALTERERDLGLRERRLQELESSLAKREEALRTGEASLAERDRQLRKLEGVLEARERGLPGSGALVPKPASELAAARLAAESLVSGQAGLLGFLQELGRGYEQLGLAMRQLSAQTAAIERGQEAVQAELDSQREQMLRWAGQFGEYEESLRNWRERLALAEAQAEEAALSLQPPPEAAIHYEWRRDFEVLAASVVAGAQEQATVQLPDGRSVVCGVTVRREHIRRQYPMAVEVWARLGEETAGRLLVGYGMDVRTMPADLLRERSLAVIVNGGEAFALPVGGVSVHAVVTYCEFATTTTHRVSRDCTAFVSLGVTFRVAVDADAGDEAPVALGPGSNMEVGKLGEEDSNLR